MAAPLRMLGCLMTLMAMLTPWAGAVRTALHLALDPHRHEAALVTHDDVRDAASVLHGHVHEDGTPVHSHDATSAFQAAPAPVPSLAIHPAVVPFVSAISAADAAFLNRLDPSPPPRVPIVLRI